MNARTTPDARGRLSFSRIYGMPGFTVRILLTNILLAGCITDATVELTKAPFDATTDVSHGTTNAIGEFTEPTTEFLSSTTPGAWFAADGTVKAEHKAQAFAAFNVPHLQAEVARGGGESLSALATLLGLPRHQHAAWFRFAQAHYPAIYGERGMLDPSVSRVLRILATFPMRAGSAPRWGSRSMGGIHPWRLPGN